MQETKLNSIIKNISELDKINSMQDKEIEHLNERVTENISLLRTVKNIQEKQELEISSLKQSRHSQTKMQAILLSITGALIGYIIKTLSK